MIFVIKQITVFSLFLSSISEYYSTTTNFFSTANQRFQLYCCVPVFFLYLWAFTVLNDIKTFYKMKKIWLGSFRKALIT